MKVIKHGNTYKEETCKRCGCVFEYNENDIKVDSDYREYFGDFHCSYEEWVGCPECYKTIWLSVVIDGEDLTDKWNNK